MATVILDRAVRDATGESADVLRRRSIADTRRIAEERHNSPLKFISVFPFIGRGNILRDRTVTRADVERALDDGLRDE